MLKKMYVVHLKAEIEQINFNLLLH